MQLFTLADHRRVAAGEFRVTFRLWKSSHVKVGATYSTGFGGAYHIEDVRLVKAGDLTDKDAWSAGFPNREAMLKLVGAHTKTRVTARTKLHRVQLKYLDEEPERPKLEMDEIVKRLQRLDKNQKPWTFTALRLIERHPRVYARELAREAGFETQEFKINVRKLKRLGLTMSFTIGYELTELGQACLDRLKSGSRA